MREGWSWRRLVQVFRRDPRDEIYDELHFHLEQRVRDYVARGMDAESARRAALERLGDLERARAECAALLSAERRTEERRMRLNASLLDVKLGVRMLAKYPGLSLVSVLGMAVAIAIGAGVFGAVGAMLDPTLPLPGGDRIVAVQNNRADSPGNQDRQVLHDFAVWQTELTMVRDLGAFRRTSRNLIIEGRGTDLVEVAEISAEGFRVVQIPPLLGRPLVEDDERAGAPPVLVIGHNEWQRRFDGDPDIIGQTVRLGETMHTVVGVMPGGFRFPLNCLLVPLRQASARNASVGSILRARISGTAQAASPTTSVMPSAARSSSTSRTQRCDPDLACPPGDGERHQRMNACRRAVAR